MAMSNYPLVQSDDPKDLVPIIRQIVRLRTSDVGDFNNLQNRFDTFFPPDSGGDFQMRKDTPLFTMYDTAGGSANYRMAVFSGEWTIQTVDNDGNFISNKILVEGGAQTLHLTSSTLTWGGLTVATLDSHGAWQPPSLADGTASNNSIYFSTTASKLVYKDAAGSTHALY